MIRSCHHIVQPVLISSPLCLFPPSLLLPLAIMLPAQRKKVDLSVSFLAQMAVFCNMTPDSIDDLAEADPARAAALC